MPVVEHENTFTLVHIQDILFCSMNIKSFLMYVLYVKSQICEEYNESNQYLSLRSRSIACFFLFVQRIIQLLLRSLLEG